MFIQTGIVSRPKTVRDATGLKLLIPTAAMLLALPAGESRDEFAFSETGRVYSKDRNRLSPVHLEQITVITMFIKNFGWSQEEMIEWLNGMLPRARLKAAADKEASIQLNYEKK